MSREMKSGNVLSAMRYTRSSSFESGRASGRSFTMAGLHARGGDRPVDGTLQHLKGEGASTPPQRWVTSTERTECDVFCSNTGAWMVPMSSEMALPWATVSTATHTRWRPFEGFVRP